MLVRLPGLPKNPLGTAAAAWAAEIVRKRLVRKNSLLSNSQLAFQLEWPQSLSTLAQVSRGKARG